MAISKLTIQEFITGASNALVLDVRSPGEYRHAHIPGAYPLPLFTDDERKVVGTAYKQESREKAIKLGLGFFGPKMVTLVEEVQALLAKISVSGTERPRIIVHCWRGGMRSAGVAWLLDLYGFEVYTLTGGYKAWRNWALQQFSKPWPLLVTGGYTGTGKTGILLQLRKQGHPVIDLEGLASHRGSAFGDLPGATPPSQEMFENLLATELHRFAGEDNIWIEDESQRIGPVNIPTEFFRLMHTAPLYFIEIPFEERLGHIIKEYGDLEKEQLTNAILRIRKRLGGLEAKTAISFLAENNIPECFRVLLTYYDKLYRKSLQQRVATTVELEKVDPVANTSSLLQRTLQTHD